MTRGQFLRNLFQRGVDRRVHRPKEDLFSSFEGLGSLRQFDAANDHEIDIARRLLLSARLEGLAVINPELP